MRIMTNGFVFAVYYPARFLDTTATGVFGNREFRGNFWPLPVVSA